MKGHAYRQLAVLFVDDDEPTRHYFRTALEPEFWVLTAASAAEALELLRAQPDRIGVVCSDQRLTGDSGAALLGKVQREAPRTVRILTTAYADIDAAVEAVNGAGIYKYLVKPWDLPELRLSVRRAREYRLLRGERDLLLGEKLTTLQHVVVADRVRSLAVLARGLSHHIRNALTALESYVFLAKTELENDSARSTKDFEYWREIWTDAESVNRHLLALVENVSAATIDPSGRFDDQVELGVLLHGGHAEARASDGVGAPPILAAAAPVLLRCDAALMTRMFAGLVRQMARIGGSGTALTAEHLGRTTVWGSPAEWLRLRTTGEWNGAAVASLLTPFAMAPYGAAKTDTDLLTAFFIVHHHGGTLDIHTRPPEGPSFELKLPHDPRSVERPALDDALLERLFLHAEDWARVQRGG
ncbi:MAG TPA: response regulator [Polyangiaceae bacterium]|nr:response regulator [Polyangiaceae bacterium]